MKTAIVLGLGFGDEGKGVVSDWLCRQAERPLVVRFSGGHQAGHTVVAASGRSHVFSNFGAGTLAGAPTFWSRYCTFYPIGVANEYRALVGLGEQPVLYVDGRAAVTTPYDLLYNRSLEDTQRHGSCGLGFGSTVARHEGPHKIHVLDLFDDFVLEQKLASVAAYYQEKLSVRFEARQLEELLEAFYQAAELCRSIIHCTCDRAILKNASNAYDALVFEGSQGLLLDQDFGYFPHVTRAHVSSRNALELVQENGLPDPEIYYVTRAYQTRHGNGPLTNEHLPPQLHPTPYETNVHNPWQGEQRRSLLDLDQLRYALAADAQYATGLTRNLVVTCLDQLDGAWWASDGPRRTPLQSVTELAERLGGHWQGRYGNYGQVGQPVEETASTSSVQQNNSAT